MACIKDNNLEGGASKRSRQEEITINSNVSAVNLSPTVLAEMLGFSLSRSGGGLSSANFFAGWLRLRCRVHVLQISNVLATQFRQLTTLTLDGRLDWIKCGFKDTSSTL